MKSQALNLTPSENKNPGKKLLKQREREKKKIINIIKK